MSKLKDIIDFYEELNKDVKYCTVKTIDFEKDKNIKFKNIDEPVLVKGLCKHTKAYSKWNMDNICEVFGDRPIETEVFDDYDNAYLCKVEYMTQCNIRDFIERTKNEYLYVGEQDITDFRKPELFKDIENPYIDNKSQTSVMFFGKFAGSTTHIHVSNDYILNQIFGQKTVYLFDFYDNYDKGYGFGNPCDPIDELFLRYKHNNNKLNFDIRLTEHSNLKIYKVVLEPGDSLLIPPWWWHNAFSEDFSCSITQKYFRTDHSYLLKYPEILLYNFCLFLDHGFVMAMFSREFYDTFDERFIQLIIVSIAIIIYFCKVTFITLLIYFIWRILSYKPLNFNILFTLTFIFYTLYELYYL